jgi:hypothetical protein
MNKPVDINLTELYSKISENCTIANDEQSTTVKALDYFNITMLKGSLTNNTIMKDQPSVSNNTVLV